MYINKLYIYIITAHAIEIKKYIYVVYYKLEKKLSEESLDSIYV